jgi:fido (protein-threonine AMPylation protein)
MLFGDVYPWAGQDRIETAPDIAEQRRRPVCSSQRR